MTVATDARGEFRTHGELEAHLATLQGQMKAAAANLEFEKAATLRDRIKQLRSRELGLGREPALGGRRLVDWLKAALLEVQEYVRMVGKVGRAS